MNSRKHDCLRPKGSAGSVHSQLLRALPARTGQKWPAAILGGATTPGSPPLICVARIMLAPKLRGFNTAPKSAVRAACGNPSPLRPGARRFDPQLSAWPLHFVSAGIALPLIFSPRSASRLTAVLPLPVALAVESTKLVNPESGPTLRPSALFMPRALTCPAFISGCISSKISLRLAVCFALSPWLSSARQLAHFQNQTMRDWRKVG
jgi:hypothetical protein